ncbi:unnamed protein product, partial [Arabidopsis lyrata]
HQNHFLCIHFTILLHLNKCHTFIVPKRYDFIKCKYQLKSSPAKSLVHLKTWKTHAPRHMISNEDK